MKSVKVFKYIYYSILGLGLETFPELEADYKLYNTTQRRLKYGSFSGINTYPDNVDWIYSRVYLFFQKNNFQI